MQSIRSKDATTHSEADFERITKAIGKTKQEVFQYASRFEAAGHWYERDAASPRRIAPSKVKYKLEGTAAAVRKLLYWQAIWGSKPVMT
jgi:hypothetical protein